MVYEATGSAISLEVISATADIPQRRFVIFDGTAGLALPGTTAGNKAKVVGVTLEGYDDSEADLDNASTVIPVARIHGGKVEVEAGEALARGALVVAGDDGRAMVSTGTAGTNLSASDAQNLGIVEIAAAAAGQIATIIAFRGRDVDIQ